jgi:hypothetical protein
MTIELPMAAIMKISCFLECDAVYPEDGGSRFLRNIGEHLLDYTVSHPRRQAGSVSYKACMKTYQKNATG